MLVKGATDVSYEMSIVCIWEEMGHLMARRFNNTVGLDHNDTKVEDELQHYPPSHQRQLIWNMVQIWKYKRICLSQTIKNIKGP